MATPVAEIDYHHLASLAEQYGVPFDELCRRAEEEDAKTEAELMGAGRIPPNEAWVTSEDAAAMLSVSYSTFMGAASGGILKDFGLSSKSRSKNNPDSRRGCGVLYKRADLDEVRRIRSILDCSLRLALKVFEAKRRNLL